MDTMYIIHDSNLVKVRPKMHLLPRRLLMVIKAIFLFGLAFAHPAILFPQNKDNTSISMLNYLTTESRLIINAKNNRLLLEETYNRLINNTWPEAVDEATQTYTRDMRDVTQRLRLIEIQRARLRYILDKKQGQALANSMPNPLYVISAINFSDLNPKRMALKLVANTAAMTIDSVSRYKAEIDQNYTEFLTKNWELDDQEDDAIYQLRDETYDYMIDLVQDRKVVGYETLNENAITDFINNQRQSNRQRRIDFLESAQAKSTYAKYGPYWLELAKLYYDEISEITDGMDKAMEDLYGTERTWVTGVSFFINGDTPTLTETKERADATPIDELGMYRKCLDAVEQYENIQARIFRKDYDYAAVLPKAIMAASYVYQNSQTEYQARVNYYLQKLIENTNESQWQLRYFAAQVYISLASSANRAPLQAAYSLLYDNVRILAAEHEKLLEDFYTHSGKIPEALQDSLKAAREEVANAKIKRDAYKSGDSKNKTAEKLATEEVKKAEEKVKSIEKEIKNYQAYLKKELPPFNDALWVNYVTVLKIMDELAMPDAEYKKLYNTIGDAFFQQDSMERYWKLTPEDKDYGSTFTFNSGWLSFNNSYYLKCPDALLTAVKNIDMRLYDESTGKVTWSETDVSWRIHGDMDRKAFPDKRLSMAEVCFEVTNNFKADKKKAYRLDIEIKNFSDNDSYAYWNLLHFTKAAGTDKWVFDYVE